MDSMALYRGLDIAAAKPGPAERSRVPHHPLDVRRIVRALEVWEMTGRPISDWQQQWPNLASGGREPPDNRAHVSALLSGGSRPPLAFWLDRPREELYARIDARVHAMIDQG